MLVTANNHICDGGLRGILQTDAHLNQYGFMHTGTFTGKSERRFVLAKVDGIKVGFLSYTKYYNNRHLNFTPEGRDALLNKYSAKKVRQDVKALKKAGAEYIIAYIHWGTEYQIKQNKSQETTAKEMADAGVDCVVGSHPHVIQPYTTIRAADGRKVQVFYSLGNFVSHMEQYDTSKDSLIVRLKLKRNKKGKVYLYAKTYIPCRTVTKYYGRNYAVVPLTAKRCETVSCKEELIRSNKRIRKILGKDINTLNAYRI
jgi:poly-gamma-glutamate synthesis protein (capsule biosynthesis protein)